MQDPLANIAQNRASAPASQILGILRKRKWLILAISVCAAVATGLVVSKQPRVYEATGRSLRTFKDACAVRRMKRTRIIDLQTYDSPIACGLGLSFQNAIAPASVSQNTFNLGTRALNAMIFRAEPKAFNLRGTP